MEVRNGERLTQKHIINKITQSEQGLTRGFQRVNKNDP